jgi:hypothetical protein
MSSEKVQVSYAVDKKTAQTLQAMAEYSKKDVNLLVETALKYFIATHNDYLGHIPIETESDS